MKIKKNKLRKLIREAFIGRVNKPPVSFQGYSKQPDLHPKVASQLRSGDPEQIRTGLELQGTLFGDDMAFAIADASLEDEAYIKKAEPFDRGEAKAQAVISQLGSMNTLRGKVFDLDLSLEYGDYLDFDDAKVKGDIIDAMYDLISKGRDQDAKQLGINYLNTDFIQDNPQAFSNLEIDKVIKKSGAKSFGDLYYNQISYKIDGDDISIDIPGLIYADVLNWYSIGMGNIKTVKFISSKLSIRDTKKFNTGAEAKKYAFAMAKKIGILSQSRNSHPLPYFFKKEENSSPLSGHVELHMEP